MTVASVDTLPRLMITMYDEVLWGTKFPSKISVRSLAQFRVCIFAVVNVVGSVRWEIVWREWSNPGNIENDKNQFQYRSLLIDVTDADEISWRTAQQKKWALLRTSARLNVLHQRLMLAFTRNDERECWPGQPLSGYDFNCDPYRRASMLAEMGFAWNQFWLGQMLAGMNVDWDND